MIPEDVWLTNLTATVSPAVQLSDSGSSSSSGSGVSGLDSVQGPSLQIEGCGDGHEAVATFLAALRDIDGVTRVSVLSSDRPDSSTATEAHRPRRAAVPRETVPRATSSPSSSIVAAFDAVQIGASTERGTRHRAIRLRSRSGHREQQQLGIDGGRGARGQVADRYGDDAP